MLPLNKECDSMVLQRREHDLQIFNDLIGCEVVYTLRDKNTPEGKRDSVYRGKITGCNDFQRFIDVTGEMDLLSGKKRRGLIVRYLENIKEIYQVL
jgi:hypothetical protein